MSLRKIKKTNLPRELLVASSHRQPKLEDTKPPAELDDWSRSMAASDGEDDNASSLLKATIDGQEYALPFEIVGNQSPERKVKEELPVVPHLNESNISRLPFQCPVGGCGQPNTLLMFATHIGLDHRDVLRENLWPGEPNTVLVDPLIPEETVLPRAHKLYMVSGKFRGLGQGAYRDKLPFVLMSSKFRLPVGEERLILWVTGPDAGGDLRQRYTIEAGRNDLRRLLPYAMAFSGDIVPLHSSQEGAEVHRSGAGLVIPEQQLDFLTDRRTKLLEVCIHFH